MITREQTELILKAASHLLGLGLSSHTDPIPKAQAEAVELSEALRALAAEVGAPA